jgi:hypothetical protein
VVVLSLVLSCYAAFAQSVDAGVTGITITPIGGGNYRVKLEVYTRVPGDSVTRNVSVTFVASRGGSQIFAQSVTRSMTSLPEHCQYCKKGVPCTTYCGVDLCSLGDPTFCIPTYGDCVGQGPCQVEDAYACYCHLWSQPGNIFTLQLQNGDLLQGTATIAGDVDPTNSSFSLTVSGL